MNIYDRLIRDHRKHAELAAKIIETTGDSPERRSLFETFRVELEAHATAEDQTLFAAMMGRADASREARHSVAEHKKISDKLEELAETDMSSGVWLRRFKDLWDYVKHHEDEEERDIFPAGDEALSSIREALMVPQFEFRKVAAARDERAG